MMYLGIIPSAFEILLSEFNRVWQRKKTRTFRSKDVLGLDKLDLQTKASLLYLRNDASLCLVLFGPCHGQLSWPELNNHQLIRSMEPFFIDVFGFVDGLNLSMRNRWDADLQNAHYNGWNSQCFLSQILV